MKTFKKNVLALICILGSIAITHAQDLNGVYFTNASEKRADVQHELKIHGNYLILSEYETAPAKFIKTLGGFFELKNDSIQIDLEFNSNFATDSIQSLKYPIAVSSDQLVLGEQLVFKPNETLSQDLDGPWLFGTRGPDTGQERRGDTKTRKTLKFLVDGRFQWIAYDTKAFQFKGTGGGSYTAVDGKYTENIEYFSRDNKRVGASLEFNYELKEIDWHHTGKNSKGEPMYEIWGKR